MSNTGELTTTVPADPLSALKGEVSLIKRWFEGHSDEETGKHVPGVNQMVGELYADHVLRKERREAIARNLASGSILAALGIVLNYWFGHK